MYSLNTCKDRVQWRTEGGGPRVRTPSSQIFRFIIFKIKALYNVCETINQNHNML